MFFNHLIQKLKIQLSFRQINMRVPVIISVAVVGIIAVAAIIAGAERCAVSGCNNKPFQDGYCSHHYLEMSNKTQNRGKSDQENLCKTCNGSGVCISIGKWISVACEQGRCGWCHGSGREWDPDSDIVNGRSRKCTSCGGSGICSRCNGTFKCQTCNGTGKRNK